MKEPTLEESRESKELSSHPVIKEKQMGRDGPFICRTDRPILTDHPFLFITKPLRLTRRRRLDFQHVSTVQGTWHAADAGRRLSSNHSARNKSLRTGAWQHLIIW